MPELQARHGRNLANTVKDVPVYFPLPLPGAPYMEADVSEDDMGKNDPNTINYINIKTNNIPSGYDARIKQIEEMIDLTHRWLDIHAGIQTKRQKDKGNLPTDMSIASQLKRSDYRIKVVDTIMYDGDCNWINLSREDWATNRISVKKAEFHTKILQDILAGITTVSAISNTLETVLKSISDIIVECKDQMQERSSWSFFNVFTWDDVTKDVKGSIRIIWYKVSGEMIEYTVHKSSYQEVKMEFDFHQTDYTFIDTLWASAEGTLKDFLKDYGDKKIRDPIGGDIDP